MKRNAMLAVLCLSLLAVTAGCFEVTSVVTLNPDGSGKATFDNYIPLPPQMGMGGEEGQKPDPAMLARQALQGMLAQSKGVDAWSDLSCEVAQDKRVHLKGVAYFPDVAKFTLGGNQNDVKWAKNEAGGMTLEMALKLAGGKPKPEPKEMTEAELAAAVKAARDEWQQSRGVMAAILGTMKMDFTYVLPGTPGEIEGFARTEKGLSIVFEGKKLLDFMDKVIADDKALAEMLKAGKNPIKDGPGEEAMMEALFGKKLKALKASVGGDLQPLFDYKAEMGKAKEAQEALLKNLGIEPAAGPAPAKPE